MSPIELAAAFFGLLSVWLYVRESVWSWPTGLVMVVLYIEVFYRAKLYADVGLQVIYVGLQVYGWYEWLHGGPNRSELRVSRAPAPLLILLLATGAVGTAVLGYLLHRYTDAALPYWDSAIAAFSLVAQWMLAKKLLENWLFWIAVDVVAVGVYFAKGLYPTTLLYAVLLGMATLGYFQWRRVERGMAVG
jgi:nicotinamide mononucleotide transporter